MKVNSFYIIFISFISILIALSPFLLAYYRFSLPQASQITDNTPGSNLMKTRSVQATDNPATPNESEFTFISQDESIENKKTDYARSNQTDTILSPMLIFTIVGIILVGVGLFF